MKTYDLEKYIEYYTYRGDLFRQGTNGNLQEQKFSNWEEMVSICTCGKRFGKSFRQGIRGMFFFKDCRNCLGHGFPAIPETEVRY
jgi:hypothetical protein